MGTERFIIQGGSRNRFYCGKKKFGCKAKLVYDDVSYKYEFIKTRHGRELIFQNFSYTRFGPSIFYCSSRKSRLCDARVMLDDSKLVIISADHNHLPPFLTRNENGTVTRFLNKSQITNKQRREKATLGPRATRYEVDCLVASIMQEIEFNQKQPTEPPVEAEITPNNNSGVPRKVTRDLSSEARASVLEAETTVSEVVVSIPDDKTLVKPNEGLQKNKIEIPSLTEKTHQNEFASYVYQSTTNRTRALTKLMAGTLGSEPTAPQTSVSKTFAVGPKSDSVESLQKQHVSPVEENSIVVPTGVDVPIKQEPCLLPNQMYIVLPPAISDANKIRHNHFIIPTTQNTGGIIYNNKILLSPVKIEANSEITGVQAKRNGPNCLAGNILNKDGNAVATNKMFIVVRTNDCGSILQNNEKVAKTTDKVPNKMFILVHSKNEKETAVVPATNASDQPYQNTAVSVSSSIKTHTETALKNKLATQKTVLKTSVPISNIKNIILPPKSDSGGVVISKSTILSKKPDGISVDSPSKINSVPAKSLNLSRNINIKSSCETCNQLQIRSETGSVIPRLPITIPKRTETVNILRKNAHSIMPMKINMMTQTLPSDLILEDKMSLSQIKTPIKHYQTIISGEARKIAGTEGNIQQADNLDIDTKLSSILPLKSPKKDQITFEMQNNLQLPVIKSSETDSPGCSKELDKVVVKTEAGTFEVSDNTVFDKQKNWSNKTEIESENFKEDLETETVPSEKEQPTVSKPKPKEEGQIIHSVSYSKEPISNATEDSMKMQRTTTHKDQLKTPGHCKSQDHLSNNQLPSPSSTKANGSAMKIDLDWIVPRNKEAVQTKINTNFTSNDLKQTHNVFNFGKTSNTTEIPIPVSMIPLPNESSPLVSTSTVPKTDGNNARVSVGTPVVMIERLSMKRKAGRSSMYGVPPKKRHYQP